MAIKILVGWSTQGWLTLQTLAMLIIFCEPGTRTGPGVPGEFLPVQHRKEGFFISLLSKVCFLCTVSTFNLASSSTTALSQQLWDHLALVVDLPEVSVGVDLEFFQVPLDKPLLFAVSALTVCLTLPSDLLSVFPVTSLTLLFQLSNDSGPSISAWGSPAAHQTRRYWSLPLQDAAPAHFWHAGCSSSQDFVSFHSKCWERGCQNPAEVNVCYSHCSPLLCRAIIAA